MNISVYLINKHSLLFEPVTRYRHSNGSFKPVIPNAQPLQCTSNSLSSDGFEGLVRRNDMNTFICYV